MRLSCNNNNLNKYSSGLENCTYALQRFSSLQTTRHQYPKMQFQYVYARVCRESTHRDRYFYSVHVQDKFTECALHFYTLNLDLKKKTSL